MPQTVSTPTDGSPRLGVFVGRFQPFHEGHLHVMVSALEHVDHLLVLVGSADAPRGLVNTFTVSERIDMIRASLAPDQLERVTLMGLEDSKDSNDEWVASVKQKAHQVWEQQCGTGPAHVTLVGHSKDHTSYYLCLFPEWASLDVHGVPGQNGQVLSATPLREHLLGSQRFWFEFLDREPGAKKGEFIERAVDRARPAALAWLDSRPAGIIAATIPLLRAFVQSAAFEDPCREAAYAAHFRYAWRHSPYAPMFVTADPVVFHGDHVLMIRRADYPGRGQWALPGGFVEADEPIYEACLRELVEETALGLDKDELHERRFFYKHYDHPRRSVRGRVITHAYGFFLDPASPRPQARFNDESLDLAWVHVNDLRRDQSFEDHYNIVHRFHARLQELRQA